MAEEEALAGQVASENEIKLAVESVEPEEPVIELGDRIRIFGGKYDKATGKVIFRTESEIHIIPDGLTNQVIEFQIDEEGFDPALNIESVEILQKRKKPTLVEILDLRVGQTLETFSPDGEPFTKYTIRAINPESDTITIHNETDGDLDIPFGFRGIPKELPFRVIRGRQGEDLVEGKLQDAVQLEDETGEYEELEGEGVEQVEEEGLEDFQFLDDELLPAGDDGVEQLIEIPTSERTYSNQTQKSEAYADLLSLNTPARQKTMDTQKATRVLVEIFFNLRAAIMRTSDDGTPRGVKPSSIQTLVDALDKRLLMLSRAVVDVDKIIYHDMDPQQFPQDEIMDGLRLLEFNKKIEDSSEYLESSPEMAGQKFTQFLNGYLQKYGATWRERGAQRIAFQKDEEVFRRLPPEREAHIPGYPCCLPPAKKGNVSSENVNEVPMSLIRALKVLRNRVQILQPGEEATVLSYVVFPLKFAASLSPLKQESLISDIIDGQKLSLSMKEILKVSGDITDIPSSNQPFLVSVDGGTLGNITLRDYIKAMGLRAEGMGDIWPVQVLMGMNDREWTIDQFAALKELIGETQNQILKAIIQQRETLAQQVAQPPAVQGIQMVPDAAEIIEKIAAEPLLKELQEALKEQMPAFANSDITMVGLLLRNHPELTMAQLADQPAALTKSRMKYARDEYLRTLRDIQMKKARIDFAGEPPEPIHCSHVKPLAMIRKVKDNSQRLALLSKFLITFQGHKENNWIKCNAGNHNLLCMHELLQIYQYLRPGDVAALNKDIQLNFGGGQFQGHYICRNCGQPISELEYDTHLEFDDSGRPMMGRSVLEDTDTISQGQIDTLLGPLGPGVDELEEYEDPMKKLIYTTAKELADRLFAPLEFDDFALVVARVFGLFQQMPDRKRYSQIQEAQKRGKVSTVTSALIDYDVYINQALVCATAVHLLILIQTRKPDLILRGMPTGCRNLGGQPLEPEGGTNGIQCVISVLSSFQKDSAPWNLTQFQKEPDDSVRQKTIMGVFEPFMRASLQDPTVLQALSQKREYIRKVLGAAGGQGRPDEELPANFAPIPYIMKEEDFVEKIIVPEAASQADRVELWIRQGNFLAKKHKLPMPLAFSESSCCLSPLATSDEFWSSGEGKPSLPPFSLRTGIAPPPKITRIEPTMKPSDISRPLPSPPESSYYQLFLKVCYDGENKGRSHEFGLTHKCIWCDLVLPTDFELLTAEQSLTTIETQGIEVTKESFEDLLNQTHKVNRFESRLILEIPGPLQNWEILLKMEPEPFIGFKEIMSKTTLELNKLPPDAKEVEVALALSDFSILAEEAETGLKRRMPQTQHDLLDSIERGGAGSVIRFLQAYILVPLSQFTYKSPPGVKVRKSWGLSWQHQQDVAGFLTEHRSYLSKFNKVEVTPWLKAKVETFIAQVRPILDTLAILRPLQVPGGKQTYEYLLKLFLFAPLANFADPSILPMARDAEAPSHVEPGALFPAKFVSEMLNRFKFEGLALTPEQIREMIAARKEEEKANILRTMTKMSRAEKDISMIQMKLGIGDWAVGGTKAIYAYDADQYDKEKDQRAKAGIVDFTEFGPEPGAEGLGQGRGGQGGALDALGYARGDGDEGGYIDDDMLGEINHFDDDN